ncbi:MAG: site-specific integrase [Alphaproteobacteria bacterium]|nr:site-specific integrase [Alphaproteobacteria bacterium]
MSNYNAHNERIKREYFEYLVHAEGKSEATITETNASLLRWEKFIGFTELTRLQKSAVVEFKSHLMQLRVSRTGEPLQAMSQVTIMTHLKAFYLWLSKQAAYKRHINLSYVDYFRLTANETRGARGPKLKQGPSLAQIRMAFEAMPTETEVEMRNRAMFVMPILTGVRIHALITLRLKHVDVENGVLFQPAKEVRTKFGKNMVSAFFPVDTVFRDAVEEWVLYLTQDKGFQPDDPLFPAPLMAHDTNRGYYAAGVSRDFWLSTSSPRMVFLEAFERVGLPRFTPHSFRCTLALIGQERCQTPQEMKAWSQNLGHQHMLTTFTSYGTLPPEMQHRLIQAMA